MDSMANYRSLDVMNRSAKNKLLPRANSALLKNENHELIQCIVGLLPQFNTQGDVLTVGLNKDIFVLDLKKLLCSKI